MKGRQVAVHEKRPNPHIYRKTVIAKNILNTRFSLSSCKITDKGNISKETFLSDTAKIRGNAQSESRVHIF